MTKPHSGIRKVLLIAWPIALVAGGIQTVAASDHGDAPAAAGSVRQDANITDFHAFVKDGNLVLALSTNPAIPVAAKTYRFPSDLTFEFNIDATAGVLNGVVQDPSRISKTTSIRINFRQDGSMNVRWFDRGVEQEASLINAFAGLRDDPFIRAPRNGRNVGAVVVEAPLGSVLKGQSTILAWATSSVHEFTGVQHESTGDSLFTMFPDADSHNFVPPWQQLGRPDVLVFDTAQAAAYPNGRALGDDVIDLACQLRGECRVFNLPGEGASGPKHNDLPFLTTFPYLAAPHLPST